MQHAVAEVNTLSEKSYSIEALELLRNDIFYHKNSKRILSTHILFKLLAGRYLTCDFCRTKQRNLGKEMIKFGYKKNLAVRQIQTLITRLTEAGLITYKRESKRATYDYELTDLGVAAHNYYIDAKKTAPQTKKTAPQINSQTSMIPGVQQKNCVSIYPYPYLISKNNIRSNAETKSASLPSSLNESKPRTRSFFDLRRLGKFGFGRLQDRQLNSLGLDAKIVQDSIETFADAMERDSRFEKSIFCKISYFMAMMRRDGCFAKLPAKETIKETTPVDVEQRRMIDHIREHGDGRYDDLIEKDPSLKANPDEVQAFIANFLKKTTEIQTKKSYSNLPNFI